MEIDLFTTSAQIVNFLVLVLLLRHFLYKPITRTMDRRESDIAERVSEARLSEQKAKSEARRCYEERQELEDRRSEILAHAQEEAEEWKRGIMQQARDEAEESKARWEMAIEREKESFLKDLRRRAGEEVYRMARQVLADLADVELERHLIEVFINRLGKVSAYDWSHIATAAAGSAEGVIITTAFPLDEEARRRIGAAVEWQLDKYRKGKKAELPIKISFEESPDLISGIELRAAGRRAAWSMENYLESLEERLAQSFAGRPTEE